MQKKLFLKGGCVCVGGGGVVVGRALRGGHCGAGGAGRLCIKPPTNKGLTNNLILEIFGKVLYYNSHIYPFVLFLLALFVLLVY